MKQLTIIFLFIFCSICLTAQKKSYSKSIIIKGHITQTSDYCGGAQPSEERLAMLRAKRPLEGKIIYVRQTSLNKSTKPFIKKVITDEKGNFTVVLRSGFTYTFVEEWKTTPLEIPKDTEFIKWDSNCFKTRYETPDYSLKVKARGNPIVSINYHNPCFYRPYCGNYSGPLPP